MKILIILLLSGLIGCSTFQKAIDKKRDDKAYRRVVSDKKLLDSVGRNWERENPCGNDLIIYTPGETITDSSYAEENINFLNGVIDSLMIRGEYLESSKTNDSVDFELLRKNLTNQLQAHLKPVIKLRVDTLRLPPDNRRISLLLSDNAVLNDRINTQGTEIKEKTSEIKDLHGLNRKWILAFAGACLLALLFLILIFKKK